MSARTILERFLRIAGPVTLEDIRRRYDFPVDWVAAELERLVEERRLAHGRFTPQVEHAPPPADEFVDRRTLSQIHRRTLTILRHEVRPVPFAAYADFVARWQHVHPAERLSGEGALRQVLQQLRAAPVVGQIWERDVLPLRMARYIPGELAALCRGGELVWVGSGSLDSRRSRVQFVFRGEGAAFLEPPQEDLSALSQPARAAYDLLTSEGALFMADICDGLGLAEATIEVALAELVMAGLVTNDSLEALRRVASHASGHAPELKPLSALEEQLAERRYSAPRMAIPTVGSAPVELRPGQTAQSLGRPERARYQSAKRRVRERLAQRSPPTVHAQAAGRWAPVHRLGALGRPLLPEERAARQARQLLARHGVVTRDSLANEAIWLEWPTLYAQLNLMEMRGEIRRGYFVHGLPGVQFALSEVVERLRAPGAGERAPDDGDVVVLNACDPANLYGPRFEHTPQSETGEPLTFARVPSTWLVLRRGVPVLLAEDTGRRMTTVRGCDAQTIRLAVDALSQHLVSFQPRLTVEIWNTIPVLESHGAPLLESLDFYRDYPGMTRERR